METLSEFIKRMEITYPCKQAIQERLRVMLKEVDKLPEQQYAIILQKAEDTYRRQVELEETCSQSKKYFNGLSENFANIEKAGKALIAASKEMSREQKKIGNVLGSLEEKIGELQDAVGELAKTSYDPSKLN